MQLFLKINSKKIFFLLITMQIYRFILSCASISSIIHDLLLNHINYQGGHYQIPSDDWGKAIINYLGD